MDISQSLVAEFHKKYGVPLRVVPGVPTWEERVLRCRLIYEEFLELCDASGVHPDLPEDFEVITDGDTNLVEVADALADLKYVVDGAACTFGINLAPITREVHRSNMTKTAERRADGKILKGDAWEPPRIAALLTEQRLEQN